MPLDITGKSDAEIAELAQTARKIEAPVIYCSAFQTQFAGNDGYIIFQRPQPATLGPLGELAPFALNETVAILYMSVASLKDLSVVLADSVKKLEEARGAPIQTDYLKRLSTAPTETKKPKRKTLLTEK